MRTIARKGTTNNTWMQLGSLGQEGHNEQHMDATWIVGASEHVQIQHNQISLEVYGVLKVV
jgi:hypothetical protein